MRLSRTVALAVTAVASAAVTALLHRHYGSGPGLKPIILEGADATPSIPAPLEYEDPALDAKIREVYARRADGLITEMQFHAALGELAAAHDNS